MCSALLFGLHATPAAAFPKASTLAANPGGFGAVGAFGSLELKTKKVHGGKQWRRVLERIAGERAVYAACDENKSSCPTKVRAWRSSVRAMHQFKGWNLLAAVNAKINKLVRYRDDIVTYGRKDHWATPVEALTGQGDCEDYAILKYISLLELGVSDQQMRIVVVKDTRRGIGHAVLSVNIDGKTYVLDSLRRAPVLDSKLSRYVPYYSVNRQGQWLNIATRKRNPKYANRKTIKVSFDGTPANQTRVAQAEKSEPVSRPSATQIQLQ
ncbi:MAG: transglutaminase-like cysteine peptidase [Hyphomicrobiales bacterium]|nr:transglutaminase-like cysteine peptidase [Hyphomicrobiales bacterium]